MVVRLLLVEQFPEVDVCSPSINTVLDESLDLLHVGFVAGVIVEGVLETEDAVEYSKAIDTLKGLSDESKNVRCVVENAEDRSEQMYQHFKEVVRSVEATECPVTRDVCEKTILPFAQEAIRALDGIWEEKDSRF